LGRAFADLCVPDDVLTRLDPSSGGRFSNLLERHFAIQIANPAAETSVAQRARRWLWFAALQERSTSDEASHLWNEGAIEVPGEAGTTSRPPRGALCAAIATCGYFARLVARG
jgi:hypothetical protein